MSRILLPILFFFTFLHGTPPSLADWSSWKPSPSPATSTPELDAELIRDAPLYPPLRTAENITAPDFGTSIGDTGSEQEGAGEAEHASDVETDAAARDKRSSERARDGAQSKAATSRRVKTGDTILNIRGAVRDAIGDAGAAPGPRASSRVDTFVIRPSHRPRHRPAAPDQPRVQPSTLQVPRDERELLVEPRARAVITCDLVNVTVLRWYKDNEVVSLPTSAASGSEAVWRNKDTVVIGRASRGDAGAWRCAGLDRAGNTLYGKSTPLLIYEPVRSVYLAVDGRRLDAGNTWVPVRDKTELEVRCVAEGGKPPPELSWRLVTHEPTLDHRPYLRIHSTNYSIEGVSSSHAVVTAARELHNAALHCEAKQRQPAAGGAPGAGAQHDRLVAKLEIHVTYPPSFVISRWPGFGVSLSAGAAAALRCDVDANPPARAWWQRDDADPISSPAPAPLEGGDESSKESATLRWEVLRGSHAGWYRCRATWLGTEYSSIGYYLNVLALEDNVPSTTEPVADEEEPDHQRVEVPVGGNVQLHCPKGSVGCWWRRVVGNTSENWAPAGSHHAHGVLGIKDALYQEDGEYRCIGARAPDLARLRELKKVTLTITGGATATALSAEPAAGGWRLECGACGRALRVVWVRRAGATAPATLTPDLAQHCWRAVLHVSEPDEVWCVAASSTGGAVAVFPRRAPHPSPAPARHTVRVLQSSASAVLPLLPLPVLLLSTVLSAR